MDERGKYEWHCKFTQYGDKLDLYLTEHNGCKTFKQLRVWWRLNYPQFKLISAILKNNENIQMRKLEKENHSV